MPHEDASTEDRSGARARPVRGTGDQLRLVRKLLHRAESTAFESERQACLAKAAELMLRHSIEEALLWAEADSEGRDSPVERILDVEPPYAARRVVLYDAAGRHNRCAVIDLGSSPGTPRRVALIGYPGDVARAEMLITSLLLQMTRAMASANASHPTASRGGTAAWRRSFVTAFAWRVDERLAEVRGLRDDAPPDGSPTGGADGSEPGATSLALVLADREEEVHREVGRRYPRLRSARIDAGSSRSGFAAGVAAAEVAALDSAPLRSGRRALAR